MRHSLSDFDFTLPENLIAQRPAHPRDHARLLVYDRKTRTTLDDYFYNVTTYLYPHTTLVLNNSKVEKCRLLLPGNVEVFVVETVNPTTVRALVRPGKKFRPGKAWSSLENSTHARSKAHQEVQPQPKPQPKTQVQPQPQTRSDSPDLRIETLDIDESGLRTLSLNKPIDDPAWDTYRMTPLPPYIAQDESLSEEYQTVYADPLGSKAAPTAGLHFTPELLERIKKDHPIAEVTLHVGLGTFAPVKSENLAEHVMHAEWYEINSDATQKLTKAEHRTAVGTTSVRVLESAMSPPETNGKNVQFAPSTGETDIFITPGYGFKATDSLITNFHLPKSTLLMLVSAFMGSVDELHRVYAHAIGEQYRFYSFGDAMLIL